MQKSRVISHLQSLIRDTFNEATSAEERTDLERLLLSIKHLPKRNHDALDPIIASSLIRLRTGQAVNWYFLIPAKGGFISEVDGAPLQILSVLSPLGETLLGRHKGDQFTFTWNEIRRDYEILEVF